MSYDPDSNAPEDRAYRQQASSDAVATLVEHIDPGAMATRYVVVVEVVDSDGDRPVWMLSHPGATPQDTIGLIEYARMLEQATQVRLTLDEED